MSPETILVQLAAPILAGGLHAQVARQGAQLPYGVFTEIASATTNTLSDGVTIEQSMFQIDVFDRTYTGARAAGDALIAAIQAAFDAGALTGVQRSRRSVYEQDPKLHRIIYEISVWYH